MRRILSKGVLVLPIAMFLLTIHPLLASIEITTISHSSQGNCDGAISLEASGSAGPFSVNITDENGTIIFSSDEINGSVTTENLCNGMYTIEVQNYYQCITSLTATIIECHEIILKDLDDAIEHPTSCLSNDGGIYFRFGGPTGGTAPYTNTLYDIDGNVMPQTTGWGSLTSGIYTLSVEDANGCTADFEIELVAEFGAAIAGHTTVAPCPGGDNGAIEILVIGLTEYTITWPNGSNESGIKELEAGTYCVTISDEICDDIVECYTISDMDLEPFIIENHTIVDACPGGKNGSVSISVSGGKRPYSYQWSSDGEILTNNEGVPISGVYVGPVEIGQYCVTVTDECGSILEECYEINESSPIVIDAITENACPDFNPYSQFPPNLGSIQLNVTGGNSSTYQYKWSHSEYYQGSYPTQLEAGNYCVTVSNASGCSSEKCFDIYNRASPSIVIEDYQQCQTGDCSSAYIDISVNGGNPDETEPFTYEWFAYVGSTYFQADTEDISNLPGPGNYCVNVSSPNNCTVTKCINISDCDNVPIPVIEDAFIIPTNAVFPLGGIQLSVSPEDYTFQYSWSGPNNFSSSEESIDPANGVGTYDVIISNGCGYTTKESYKIEDCDLTVEIEEIDHACSADNLANFTLAVSPTTEDDIFYYLLPGETSFTRITVPIVFDPTESTSYLNFYAGYGFAEIAIVTQNGCGGTVVVTIEPSNIRAETFDYTQFVQSGSRLIPIYCGRATTCENELIYTEILAPIEITSTYSGDSEGCLLSVICGETVLIEEVIGTLEYESQLSTNGKTCIEGEFCVGMEDMDIAGFIRLGQYDNGGTPTTPASPPIYRQVFLINPINIYSAGPVETTYEIIGEKCHYKKFCNGELEEEGDFPATKRLECANPDAAYNRYCVEVTYCEDVLMETGLTPYPGNLCCPPYHALTGEDVPNSVYNSITSRFKESTANLTIRPFAPDTKKDTRIVNKYDFKKEREKERLSQRKVESRIFPNPTNNTLTLAIDENQHSIKSEYKVTLMNLLGEVILDQDITDQEYTFDLNQYRSGYYLLRIIDKNSGNEMFHTVIKQ